MPAVVSKWNSAPRPLSLKFASRTEPGGASSVLNSVTPSLVTVEYVMVILWIGAGVKLPTAPESSKRTVPVPDVVPMATGRSQLSPTPFSSRSRWLGL